MAQWSGNGSRPNSQPQEEPNIDLLPWVGAYNLKDALLSSPDKIQIDAGEESSEANVEAVVTAKQAEDALAQAERDQTPHTTSSAVHQNLTEETVAKSADHIAKQDYDDQQADPNPSPASENLGEDLTSLETGTEVLEPSLLSAATDNLDDYGQTHPGNESSKGRDLDLEAEKQRLGLLSQQSDIIIENISPCRQNGKFLPKFQVGDPVKVTADIFTYGSNTIRAKLRWHYVHGGRWEETLMVNDGNDLFSAEILLEAPGKYDIEIQASTDELANWQQTVKAKIAAGIFDQNDIAVGERLLKRDVIEWLEKEVERQIPLMDDNRLPEAQHDLDELKAINRTLRRATDLPTVASAVSALDKTVDILNERPILYSSAKVPQTASTAVYAQRSLCRFSAWYECFPRSASETPGKAGTIRDVIKRLDYISDMGFDVLYLPPIHPIGITNRKGKNNSLTAIEGDVGSPWAIGSKDGGHEAIARELGTLEDFHQLVMEAEKRGIEIALDIAFQCSPDHPWVKNHPNWFSHRPDGTIMCAENPPKRYEDVYPINFDTDDKEGLWLALYDVINTWRSRGVRIFRVDNPHTKPFDFWEWLLAKVHGDDPGVIFLAEAFTRPKVMHYLAKIGFDQSYTYYTWRDTKEEIIDYFNELAHGPGKSYFCPNIWPNTPDILAKSLQHGGRASFIIRLVLAGGLSPNYGIYGPVFELLYDQPVHGDSEEYRNSEKYEVKWYKLTQESSIAPVIKALNTARKNNPALQNMDSLRFHKADNANIICWTKTDAERQNMIVGVVNIDPSWTQSSFVDLDLSELGILADEKYTVRDLLDDCVYEWKGGHNFVLLDPSVRSAHLFEVILNR